MAEVDGEDKAVSDADDADEAEVKPGVRGCWWYSSDSRSILDH